MDSEYKVGAVADIIARLSQNQHSPDSTFTENESTPVKKKKGKKRKLEFSNSDTSKENGVVVKTKKKKLKTVKAACTDDTLNLENNKISNKKKKIESEGANQEANIKETKKKNKSQKRKNQQNSLNVDKETNDQEVTKEFCTPLGKDLANGSEKKTREFKLNPKQKGETNAKKKEKKLSKKKIKQSSQNVGNETIDSKGNKGFWTPPSKILPNEQSEQPKLNEKQKADRKAKQLKTKIKAKRNETKKSKSTNLTKQDDKENEQLGAQEPALKSTSKKGKKKKACPESPSTTQSETDINIPQNTEKETYAQVVASGFPKHVADSSEGQSEEPKLNEEQESRTIFVGNLPLKIPRDKVTNMFKQYGEVETVRFRSVPVGDISLPRNACIKMNKIHEKRTNMNAYVRFKNIESVEKALVMNGHVVNEHTIRVDTALKKPKANSHAIFIGNLPFEAEEEEVRKAFESCGEIDNIRIIRDQKTNTGKGFGYVNFKSADGVAFAMEMENVKIRNREVRVKRSFDKKSSKFARFNDTQIKPKSNGFARFYKNDRGANFRGNKSNPRAERGPKGVNANGWNRDFGGRKQPGRFDGRRNDNTRNDGPGFKNRDNRFNKKGTDGGGGGFKKKFDKDKNSFQGSTVQEKGNKNHQKKKLSYDALKKFIIAKKLTGGNSEKKGFNFLSK
ncbi:hypothetical protein WDU94_013340 [Cyamophila willieti]